MPLMRSASWRSGRLQARRLLRRLSPACVIGFGGYASIPTMLAAVSLGLPTAIHEQNAVLGRANRLLAPRVRRIATGFPATAGLRPADRARAVHTGNPVRPGGARPRANQIQGAATRRPDRAADPRRQPGGADHERGRAAGARRAADAAARDAAGQPPGAPGGSARRRGDLSQKSHPGANCRASLPMFRNGWRARIWRFAAPAPRP